MDRDSWIYVQKKKYFYLIVLGFEGFKEFILDYDRNIVNKILYGTEKIDKNGKNDSNNT